VVRGNPIDAFLEHPRLSKDAAIRTIIVARAGLFLLIMNLLWAVLDRDHPLSIIEVKSDHVAHALFAFTLTLAASLALPRIRPVLIGFVFFAAGALAEVAQGVGIVLGEYGHGDIIANAVGIIAALLPMGAADLRRRLIDESRVGANL
jgi:hypothetical protein